MQSVIVWSENGYWHDFANLTWKMNDLVKTLLFLFSWAEKKELIGLAIGVSSMKSSERALLHVGWELGYGKEGSFSFPNVPPMADIIYEVELIGFDETKQVSCFHMSCQITMHGCWLLRTYISMRGLLHKDANLSIHGYTSIGKSSKWHDCWGKDRSSRQEEDGWECFI